MCLSKWHWDRLFSEWVNKQYRNWYCRLSVKNEGWTLNYWTVELWKCPKINELYVVRSSHRYCEKEHRILLINPLTPNDHYSGPTAPLTSKRCILYIYSTNIGTEYFKHGIYSSFFSLQNAVCFIILTYLVPVLFTFYIQVC